MSAPLRPKPQPRAYTLEDAAAAAGTSLSTLKKFISSGDLTKRYIKSSPVILASELEAWLESLPLEPH